MSHRCFVLLCALVLGACTTAPTGEWKEVSTTSREARLERAKTICQGRSADTQVAAGRLWIAGAVASNSTFRACMAEHGFTQG